MSTQPTLKDIQLQLQFVSFESVNENYSTSKNVSKFSHLVDTTKQFVSNLLNPINVYFGGKDNKQMFMQMERFAGLAKYPELKRYQVRVPEGFEGKLLDYAKRLEEANNFTNQLIVDVIQPFNIYVGQLINNPALLNSITFKHKVDVKDITKVKKELGKFFKPNAKWGEIDFQKAFGNMKELNDYVKQMRILHEVHALSNVAYLKESVKNLNDNLGHLSDYIRSNQNNQTVNSKVMEVLAALTYSVAEQVEFYAAVNHMTSQLIYASERMDETMANFQN